MGTIITLDQAMSAPLADNPMVGTLGQIITSDSFGRTGDLFQSFTDVYRGGTPKQWLGTNGDTSNNRQAKTDGSTLQFSPQAVTSLCIDGGMPDSVLALRVISVPAIAAGLNLMIDMRKASAETGDCYRVALFVGGPTTFYMRLYKRVSGTGTQISGTDIVVPNNSTLKFACKGSSIKVFVDDVVKFDVTDTSVPAGNFVGFSASSANRLAVFDDLVLREAV